jgi:hypothetical protein
VRSEPLIFNEKRDAQYEAHSFGHTKLESTVRYLGIEVDDAPAISEQVEL